MKILRNFVLVLMIVLGVGLCFNPVEKVHAASGVGTVKNIKKSKVKYADGKKVGGKVCYGNYRIISWKKVKGASGYVVYRYDDLLNEWNKILTTKTNSFIISSLLQDETFTIKIRAYKKSSVGKVYGDYSKEFKYKEKKHISLRNKKKVMDYGCYAEGKSGYFEYGAKQAFIIQNKYRIEQGVAPLIWSKELNSVAKLRIKELVKLFSHTRPNGTYCQTAFVDYFGQERCKRFQMNYSEWTKVAGEPHACSAENCYTENIGMGSYGIQQIVDAWKSSNGHCRAMMDKSAISGTMICFRDIDNTQYWISSFAVIDVDNIK